MQSQPHHGDKSLWITLGLTLEEISTQNGPPKKTNKIIVKIIK